MNLHIELVPFTDISATNLATALSTLVAKPANRKQLPQDFPNVVANYQKVWRAMQTVWRRQGEMRNNPGFVALAVK